MGSQWVEDPSWGNIFTGIAGDFAAAPQKALSARLIAEKVKSEQISQQQELAKAAMAKKIGDAYELGLPKATEPNTPLELTALPNVDESGQWSTPDQGEAFKIPDSWVDPGADQALAVRNKFFANTARLAAMGGPAQAKELPALYAQGQANAGYPQSQQERDLQEYRNTGKWPDRSVDENKTPPKPYIVKGPDGKVIDQGVTRDFTTNLSTGKPIAPGSIQLASPTSPDVPSTLGDKGKMAEEFFALSQKANRNEPLSISDIERAHVLREQLHQESGSYQNMGGRQQFVTTRPVPVPDYAARLSSLIDGYRNGAHLQPGQSAIGGPVVAPVPYAGITGQGVPLPAGAPPDGTAAPEPTVSAPIAPTGINANAPQLGAQGPSNPAELRKEIANTQAFSDYATAISSYNTMIKAAQGDERTGLPTNASDLNIIYAIAKLFDPGSVVREGELKLAAGAAPIAQVLQSNWSRLITGEGSLTPETRAQLIGEGLKRMEQYKVAKDTTTDWYAKVATKQGLDPADVVPPTPPMLDYNKQAIEHPTLPGGAPSATTVPPAPAAAAPTTTIEDVRAREWATKNPNDPRAAAILQRLGGR